jgi:hypothetical protein
MSSQIPAALIAAALAGKSSHVLPDQEKKTCICALGQIFSWEQLWYSFVNYTTNF